ncbi:GAG-pre-integrase domain-containing protein [Hirsutella rhossiliensis]
MEDEAVFGKPDWKTDFPDGIKISEIFERAHRIKAANNSKGSFGAAFQGKGEKSERKEDKPKWSSSKNADGVPMCVCGEYHRFVDCFYLIKSARPDGWTPDQKVEKKIKEILDSNPWAKKMTEKAQDFKKKEMEKSFSTGKAVYPLYDSFILDSGSDTHICNNRSRFLDYTAPAEPEELFAGDSQLQILGYGTVRIRLQSLSLTPQALQNRQKKDLKTDPHTEIGYLVGYDSTNIFRIWIPSTSEVRRVRDVTFNESIFYDGNDQPPEPIPQRVEVQLPAHIEDESDYEEIPTQIDEPEPDPVEQSPSDQGDATTIVVQPEPSDHEDSDDQDEFHDIQHPYPTPDPGPSDSATALSPLTKALPGQKFATFVKQLGLVDISTLLGI